jgi:GDP-L-fucose synthase
VSTSSQDFDLRHETVPGPLQSTKFSLVMLLAAWTQAGTFCDTRRGEQWLINQAINTNALRFWHEYQPQAKLVAFGTSAAYDDRIGFQEDSYLQGMPHDKYAAYAWSKRSLLVGLESLAKQFGHSYLYLVPSTLAGPGYRLDGRQLHFIYDMVRKCLRSQAEAGDVVLWGDGQQRRELVDVRDAAEWILELAGTACNQVVNLGAGKDYSIRELAAKIFQALDLPMSRLKFDEAAFVGAKAKVLDTRRLDSILPRRRKTSIDLTLESILAWARQNDLAQYVADANAPVP